jgi:hypothetical protein
VAHDSEKFLTGLQDVQDGQEMAGRDDHELRYALRCAKTRKKNLDRISGFSRLTY